MNEVKDTIKQMNEYGKQHIPFVFMVDFDMKRPLIYQVDELLENDIWISIPGFSNKASKVVKSEFSFKKEPIEFNRYSKAFDIVKASINRGDTFLLNLTFPTNLHTNLTLASIFERSKIRWKIFYQLRYYDR